MNRDAQSTHKKSTTDKKWAGNAAQRERKRRKRYANGSAYMRRCEHLQLESEKNRRGKTEKKVQSY